MNTDEVSFFPLKNDTVLKPFSSVDTDLNEFLLEESKNYQNQLLATTHIIENSEKTIAYVSLFNDTLFVDESKFVSKNQVVKFVKSKLPISKRHIKSFPAIKIGRLAVCKQEKGYGKLIVEWVINYAINCNKTSACKFITVDAYAQSLGFYEKMGFTFLPVKNTQGDTKQMYLDITPFINTVQDFDML